MEYRGMEYWSIGVLGICIQRFIQEHSENPITPLLQHSLLHSS
jgi:hypothetical protein